MTPNEAESPDKAGSSDEGLRKVLDDLLERDETITARAVARLHPTIRHASSITRNKDRVRLLGEYQAKQRELRAYVGRIRKNSKENVAASLVEKDRMISELSAQVEILTASHVALIRVVGELGGMSKWVRFYESYKAVREKLVNMGAIPSAEIKKFSDSRGNAEHNADTQ